MLSNEYFLAKFRFDTAENEPAKNLRNFAKFANFGDLLHFATRPIGKARCRAGGCAAGAHEVCNWPALAEACRGEAILLALVV